ncbi:sensor histidine kinase [Dethiothermospora halolimnae]|uniref:sensor histidine kinase n=1 Tax=Dethiothermospora halolimnae TaxID=3114390 RepID=UPI003CCB9993
MLKNKTLKRDFYLLVIKIVFLTVISTIITYTLLIVFIFNSTETNMAKSSNHYIKYFNAIEKNIQLKSLSILKGSLIDLGDYSDKIRGEVLDVNGNHLFGETNILDKNINFSKSINHEIVKDNRVYRLIPIKSDNSIKGIYVLTAPFGFSINNINDSPHIVLIYFLLIASPLFFFFIYLIIFSSKLYKSVYKNINLLLLASDKISNQNFDFKLKGLKGKEFNRIQYSFNAMISALKDMINHLSSVDKERKSLISSIAHDIRTPLTIIRGQMELIEELRYNENFNLRPHIAIINNNCNQMSILTDNLSLIYKVESLNFLFRVQDVDLDYLLKNKEQEFITVCDKKNINIVFEVNLTKSIYSLDESMLIRVINNVFYNSLRFTSKGEIKFIIWDDYDKGIIHFKCIDTGTGFKEEDTSILFDPFYQSKSYKNHFGLGLYISKKIVNNYNGDIIAYNNDNKGATVEFYIEELNNIVDATE